MATLTDSSRSNQLLCVAANECSRPDADIVMYEFLPADGLFDRLIEIAVAQFNSKLFPIWQPVSGGLNYYFSGLLIQITSNILEVLTPHSENDGEPFYI